MLTLELDKAELKVVNGNRYYVFPTPPTHANQNNRPTTYVDEKDCQVYKGQGSNSKAVLHPDVHNAANTLMTALLDYGRQINDKSILSAVIQEGWRADDALAGETYLYNILTTVRTNALFANLTFPKELEADAKGVLGRRGDPRRDAFRAKVAAAPGWNAQLMYQLFQIVDNHYAPRGSNPHSTGFVFDLNFTVYNYVCKEVKGSPAQCADSERAHDAKTHYNGIALRSAAGVWLNKYAMQFNFDSYDTSQEIWHLEYRKPKETTREGLPKGANYKTNGSFPVPVK
jgi:hypothetical protein